MPVYEFRCRTCDTTFEALRPMDTTSEDVPCPDGHSDTARVLSLIAPTTRTSAGSAPAAGGGCCAGGCACQN